MFACLLARKEVVVDLGFLGEDLEIDHTNDAVDVVFADEELVVVALVAHQGERVRTGEQLLPTGQVDQRSLDMVDQLGEMGQVGGVQRH